MKKAATIHDLAAILGVSAATVWRAYQKNARISEATRTRILTEAKAIGYVPSLVAQNLSQGRTRTLGVIVPVVNNPVYSALALRVEQAAFEAGYNVILCNTYLSMEREVAYAQMLLSRRVEGVVVIPFAERSRREHSHLDEFKKRGIPVVVMEQSLAPLSFTSVVSDNLNAACAMTRYLIGLGHRRIAFGFHPVHTWDPVGRERLSGFKKAMAEAGLTREAQLLLDATELQADRLLIYHPESIEACFRKKERPTALFAGMDSLAIQAMTTLQGMGLRIPQDVSVAGFDDIEFSRFTQPPLTTVSQPIDQMAVRASELLFEQILAKTIIRRPVAARLPCKLVVRESCGAPPGMPE